MADSPGIIEAGPEQMRAASPEHFVWVSANAGSGKTHVLVDRLARLMLGGTLPGRILCLTFTNAAAAEMANRLFGRLAGWAMADDKTLTQVLKGLTGEPPDEGTLVQARKLFAIALDSPGGLKIHTIHAFCTQVLQRFPLEANVAPNFTQLDERGVAEILADIRETLMAEAARSPEAPLAAALRVVSAQMHDMGLDDLFAQFLKPNRRELLARAQGPGNIDALMTALAATLGGIEGEADETTILARHFGKDFDRGIARRAALHLGSGTVRDTDLVPGMERLAGAKTPRQTLHAHQSVFLTQKEEVRKNFMTARLRKSRPELADWIDAEKSRAEDLRHALGLARTLEATRAAMVLGHRVVTAYEAEKQRATLLDYDDLIQKARRLLSRSDDAAWVLYKLDGGIDHILVDEAQDTSPAQWDIVRHLADDMMAGQSASKIRRTVFAVGDEKQSIFSFHGADPAMFEQMRRHFAGRVAQAKLLWDAVPLEDSFRSTPEILAAVDAVFAAENAAAGLSAGATPVHHNAKRAEAGMVELWPLAKFDKTEDPDPWTVPVDQPPAGNSQTVLARQIAQQIAAWLEEGRVLPSRGWKIRPGDIMILVRRRNAFVDAMVRELKSRGVPVAGVDRMNLTGQIAVEDLMALGRFAALPEDDLTLATLLKSPLIGLTEDEVFAVAWNRKSSLWRALQFHAEAEGLPRLVKARATLSQALALADQVPPFEFFYSFLAAPGRREAIRKRLGIEADDPIDEFLNAALAYELQETPTLDGFLTWAARGKMEIKRDMEHGKDEVRVMTIHGAKGLEANIVILPDTFSVPGSGNRFALHDIEVSDTGISLPVWQRAGRGILGAIDTAKDLESEKEAAEYRRLLYVAMTRACDWLIVTGYQQGRSDKPPAGSWYDLIARGLADHYTGAVEDLGNGRLRYCLPQTRGVGGLSQKHRPASKTVESLSPPEWATKPVGKDTKPVTLTPSSLTSAGADIGEGAPAAISPLSQIRGKSFRRGALIHSLLEFLPALPLRDRLAGALRYLSNNAADLDESLRLELAQEASGVVTAPKFAPFLGSEARVEVPFSAVIEGPGHASITVSGQVDRLALVGGTLHILDYKTHRSAARCLDDVPAGILRQMALYRAALARIFPAEIVSVSILWTNHAKLMELPSAILDQALAEALAGAPTA